MHKANSTDNFVNPSNVQYNSVPIVPVSNCFYMFCKRCPKLCVRYSSHFSCQTVWIKRYALSELPVTDRSLGVRYSIFFTNSGCERACNDIFFSDVSIAIVIAWSILRLQIMPPKYMCIIAKWTIITVKDFPMSKLSDWQTFAVRVGNGMKGHVPKVRGWLLVRWDYI